MAQTVNTFIGGLVSDISDLNTSKEVVVNALNATLTTYNGQEGTMLNDLGNCKILNGDLTAQLPYGYIPIGSVEYGDVLYIALVEEGATAEAWENGETFSGTICSFPCPDYNEPKGKLLWKCSPLQVAEGDLELVTEFFKFDLNHPVTMLAEPAYDGSVNLILTDNKNIPRLINTGFAALESSTYTLVDRIGMNNTNRYAIDNQINFDLLTSLSITTNKLSRFEFNGLLSGGLLLIGNYTFYALVCDKDGNESNIICESGLIPVFIGTDGDPFSVLGGIDMQTSDKCISLTVKNIDPAYKYIELYYTIATASNNLNLVTSTYKIDQQFPVVDGDCNILFTGYEAVHLEDPGILSLENFNADKARAAAIALNMLFLGNIQENNIVNTEYEDLAKYSLTIYPTLDVREKAVKINSDYLVTNNQSYYSSKFCYDLTGYHDGEIYRFGVVFIRLDGSLTTVFDVQGVNELGLSENYYLFSDSFELSDTEFYLPASNGNPAAYKSEEEYNFRCGFNTKGVCKITDAISDLMDVVGINFKFSRPLSEMPNALNYKGLFFVRQKRIPLMLAMGYSTNICENAFVPSINLSESANIEYYQGVTITKGITTRLYTSKRWRKLDSFEKLNKFWKEKVSTYEKSTTTGNVSKASRFTVSAKVNGEWVTIYDSDSPTLISSEWQVAYYKKSLCSQANIYSDSTDSELSLQRGSFPKNASDILGGLQFTIYGNDSYKIVKSKGYVRYRMVNGEFLYKLLYSKKKKEYIEWGSFKAGDQTLQTEQKELPRYLYESFSTTNFTSCDLDLIKQTPDFYPRTASPSGSNYLRHPYKSRLFTLSDCTRAYIDKYAGEEDAITYFWQNQLSGKFDSSVWFSGPSYLVYGPSDDLDDFVCVIASNGSGVKLDRYETLLFFYEKMTEEDINNVEFNYITSTADTNGGVTHLIKSYSGKLEAVGEYLKAGDGYEVYYDEDGFSGAPEKYYIVYKDKGAKIKYNTLLGGYAKDDDYKIPDQDKVCDYWASVPGAEVNELRYVATTDLTTGDKYLDWQEVAEYLYINDQWYELIEEDFEFHRDKYQSSTNAYLTNHFLNYISGGNTSETKIINGVIEGDSNGYDFEVPTFNGKYIYLDKKLLLDLVSVPYEPMEYNAYGLYCPEFELNLPFYNAFFTGNKCKAKILTNTLYLLHTKSDRRYSYTNTSINNLPVFNNYAIAVSDNVSLMTINHLMDIGYRYYTRRKGQCYFSSKAGDGCEISFKFAGPEFLAYCSPTDASAIPIRTKKYENDPGEYDAADPYAKFKAGIKYPYNLVRGSYGPYIGFYPEVKEEYFNSESEAIKTNRSYFKVSDATAGENNGKWKVKAPDYANHLIGLYVSDYSEDYKALENFFRVRFNDKSPYQTISDRISFDDIDEDGYTCFRGDCFINFYTHRVNRNFNDTNAPYNDTIVDTATLKNGLDKLFNVNFRTLELDKDTKESTSINLGDLNAVLLGSWVTFPVRTSMNTAFRSVDDSYVTEALKAGHGRTFYPLLMDAGGSNKLPESEAYNLGYSKSGGDKLYTNINQTAFSNTYYKNRIIYSNPLQSGTTTNGTRTFHPAQKQDYTSLYGAITKLVEMSGSLLAVLEHGLMLIPINERVLSGEGAGGSVYVNTSIVLPKNPKIISDTYGSLFEHSVIATPKGYVYGVDESAKKIWRTNGLTIEIISDYKIAQFLNKYLFLDSLEVGKLELRTHYNHFKNDVMFTLYNIPKDSSNIVKNAIWNICYNENQQGWVTYYSWVPLFSGNIGNNYISTNLFNDIEDPKLKFLWKHGVSNIVPSENKSEPTKWYGEQHPFEFEFVVVGNPAEHKIFDNMLIISNKAKPHSFHYEIIGECFDFAEDKPTMYKRLELTKMLMNRVGGSNITYDAPYNLPQEHRSPKSTICPMYYERYDMVNLIYDNYKLLTCRNYDYDALSGTEVVHYPDLNEYRLCNHVKAVDIAGPGGVLRGNMRYLEDIWRVQITPISILQCNESWNKNVPIVLPTIKVNDSKLNNVSAEEIKEKMGFMPAIHYWDISNRKEIKLKDKYMKVKIRYPGNELALISAVNTSYTKSYAL